MFFPGPNWYRFSSLDKRDVAGVSMNLNPPETLSSEKKVCIHTQTLAGSHIIELLKKHWLSPSLLENIFIQTWMNLDIYQFTIDK